MKTMTSLTWMGTGGQGTGLRIKEGDGGVSRQADRSLWEDLHTNTPIKVL